MSDNKQPRQLSEAELAAIQRHIERLQQQQQQRKEQQPADSQPQAATEATP